ncbi:hypothetical protein [Fimbriiglobus ruber]|uniref:ISKra4 family transposase n=1 Tax=Fimbriiglobus ruber TaxID=1908690 RepID=A0A225DHB0_9BACT|nr:hypothetical protein [Fimbriiglobus ruber]OWK36776.1 hypothetical protein FRUB_09339 [Fimbriiglobus ruber]
MLTVNGRVFVRRIRWHGAGVGSWTVIDTYLDRAERTISVGVRELACRLNGGGTNFDRTAENLAHAADIRASGETLRVLIETEGRAVLEAVRTGTLPITWTAKDCLSDPADPASPARVYFGCDGVMAPMVTQAEKTKRRAAVKARRQRRGRAGRRLRRAKPGADQKSKEFKLVTYYDEPKRHRLVLGTKGNHVAAGRLMRRLAGRIDLPTAGEKVGIVDGAPWIRRQVDGQSLALDALGLDFYHLAENVHKARRAVYGETDAAGTTWADDVLHRFKHDGYDASWEQLVTWRCRWRGAKRAAADGFLNYVSDRRDMIQYPEFAAKGWQIGSGPTESCCKTLTQRLKGAGMRWDADNAEAIMALEAIRESGLWKTYWEMQLSLAA